jgi:hypothetical protein
MRFLRLSRLDDDAFLKHAAFCDMAIFHISGKVNRHNCWIWGSENPHEVMEHEHDTPRLNVWCALTSNFLTGPLIFEEATVRGASYQNILKNYAVIRIPWGCIFQQGGNSSHYASPVKVCLNQYFPGKWIGRGGPITWPSRSPDLTFRFLSMRVHKGLGVPNENARYGRTVSLNNCSLWDCYTSDAAE